ncbi:MAG: ribonuclease HII [Methanobacteriota archaeon]|nr:MAG: ribonuclease HII [Euryarchaeota archaeon]
MICGVDEAGRGPVIGPLVVCGVSLTDDAPLVELGVKDSKMLNRRRREELAPKIMDLCRTEVLELPAEEIDAIRARMTLNEAEAMLFARVVDRLSPRVAYVDAADASEKRFRELTKSRMRCDAEIVSRHRADELYPVVSAASIVAKVHRDRGMDLIQEELGVPVGSGYTSDPVTKTFMQTWLEEKGTLPPHVRRTWKTSQKLMNLNGIRRLDSFEG